MRLFRSIPFSLILLAFCNSPKALADEGSSPATFSFQYSGLKWSASTNKTSPANGAAESERKISSLLTSDLADSMVFATIDKFNIYFYPFLDGNALASISYMVRPDLELGIDIGLNATKVDSPKFNRNDSIYGAFATWSVPVDTMHLENMLIVDRSSRKITDLNPSTNIESTEESSSLFIKGSTLLVVPLAKNASYLGGVWIASSSATDKTNDIKSTSHQYGLVLAGFRITLE